jgi:hypothetical protein
MVRLSARVTIALSLLASAVGCADGTADDDPVAPERVEGASDALAKQELSMIAYSAPQLWPDHAFFRGLIHGPGSLGALEIFKGNKTNVTLGKCNLFSNKDFAQWFAPQPVLDEINARLSSNPPGPPFGFELLCASDEYAAELLSASLIELPNCPAVPQTYPLNRVWDPENVTYGCKCTTTLNHPGHLFDKCDSSPNTCGFLYCTKD